MAERPVNQDEKRKGLAIAQEALKQYPELREPNPQREEAWQDWIDTDLADKQTEEDTDGDTR